MHQRHRPAGPPSAEVTPKSGGMGRASSAAAERVSNDLRRRSSLFLDRRRRVAGLSLIASAAMGVVAAYQTGLVRRLPEPKLSLFDADRVDAAGEAYELLKTPDAAVGLASYAVTLALAAAGDGERHLHRPWIPLAMAAKVAFDAAGAAYLSVEQASKHRRFCSWCLLASLVSVAAVPQVVPEARAAFRGLLRRT